MKTLLSRFLPAARTAAPAGDGIVVEGGAQRSGGRARQRIVMTMAVFVAIYGVIGGRMALLALQDPEDSSRVAAARQQAARPDIVDRNGDVMATDITTASLFAEPRRIVDADEAVEQLTSVLPDLNYEQTYRRLKSDAGFVWLKRELTPMQKNRIHQLGIPGIGFRAEKRRFYPGGPTASHILGLTNIDNQGIAGIEKFVDSQGLADLRMAGLAAEQDLAPFKLSIDQRIQHIMRDELADAMETYQAIAAGAVILDVHTGEIVAMSSLPDFNPNNPFNANDKDRLNRMSAGVFEMGSTFKAFTTAMALDSGKVRISDRFDASRPIQIARFTINDFHGKRRVLSVPEIFIYSSNIGTAKMADAVGTENHQAFLHKIGLLDRISFELPEIASPTEPREWKKLNSITISFGHGVATTPLQTAVAAAALVNGGKLIPPTLQPRSREEADQLAQTVISKRTSDAMRYLFRLNVEKGSGKRAEVPGYFVGGKTGTAEKVVHGKYSANKRFNAFLSAFPMNDPKYVVLVILDEPKAAKEGGGATAGSNAAPTVGNIIRRSAALLGVKPEFGHESDALLAAAR
ncbi:MAG: penicillin-binding protein 2 [Notoacmeibacter sp.]|nr:penicillin-binding protein 2 [Notoacmeibacter sp.]